MKIQQAEEKLRGVIRRRHSNVETTIGYCHAEACSVPSPLEFITA
jgi:hypothetical protein